MTPKLMKAVLEQNLWVQKSGNVTGSVAIHFPSAKIEDIVLNNRQPVNVFGRIGMTSEQVKLSNLEQLLIAGHVQLVHKQKSAAKKK